MTDKILSVPYMKRTAASSFADRITSMKIRILLVSLIRILLVTMIRILPFTLMRIRILASKQRLKTFLKSALIGSYPTHFGLSFAN
jgi:hypothetical protein